MTVLVVKPEVKTRCPFCGGVVTVGTNPEPFVTHSYPYCGEFERLGALEFLTEINKKHLQRQRGLMS